MCPESTPKPADAGSNSQLAQYSNTPSLRVAGFEDEDEYEAPGEWHQKVSCRFSEGHSRLSLPQRKRCDYQE
jgi:hypothetical protein